MNATPSQRYRMERLEHERLLGGMERTVPFHTEDGRSLGSLSIRKYATFSLGRRDLHAELPYAIDMDWKDYPPSLIIADVEVGRGVNFHSYGARLQMESGKQRIISFSDLSDGAQYDLQEGAVNRGRIVAMSHREVAALAERYPDHVGEFWQMIQGFEGTRSMDALKTPLQLNCMNAIFAQPLLGNMMEEYVRQQIVTYLSTIGSRSSMPAALGKVSNCATLRSKMHDIRTIIDQQPSAPFTLRNLALAVGTNENYLKAAFSAEFGQTVFRYIFERRMLTASLLLRDTDLSMEAIATAAGYLELSNFSLAFRRRFGMSPTQYRMAVRG